MSCKRIATTNNQESELFNSLYEYTKNEEIADQKYAYFRENEDFLNDFGNWTTDNNIDLRKLDDNLEPKLFKNEKGLYYINKKNENVYIFKSDTSSPEFSDNLKKLYSNDYISRISELLLFNFVKNRINDNFNELDLSESDQSLKDSILTKLKSKSEELSTSSDFLQQSEGAILAKSIDHIDEWVSSVINKFRAIKLIYKEQTEAEDQLEEENSERGEIFRSSSFEKDSKDNISANIKLRLSLLQSNELDDIFYEPKLEKFDEVYNTLQRVLTDRYASPGEDMFQIYLDEIAKLSVKKPYLKNLHLQLSNKNLSPNVKAEFVQAFNLNRNNFVGTIYNIKSTKEGYIITSTVQNLSDVGAKHTFVKNQWYNNYTKKTIVPKNFKESYNKFYANYKNTLSKSNLNVKEAVESIKQYLSYLGIETTEQGFNHYLDGLNSLLLDENERISNLTKLVESLRYFSERLEGGSINKADNPFNDQIEFTNLAKAEAFFLTAGSDSSIFTTGKSKWVYSYPSYLSNKLKEWSQDRESLLNHYNSTEYNKGSYYMKYLLAIDKQYPNPEKLSKERISNFKLNVFNSLQEKGDAANASDNKTLSKNDAFVDAFNKILGFRKGSLSYFSTPTPADKSTQYQFSVPADMMISSNVRFIAGKIDFAEASKDIIFNYIKSEWERIKYTQEEIDNKDSSELRVHYHLGNKNGLKFQLFPSLSYENFNPIKAGFSLYDKNGKPLPIDLETVKDKMYEMITEKVGQEIRDMYLHMKKIGVLEETEQGLINRGIDTQIWDSYEGKNVGFKVAGDIYINSLISNVEYSKMFAGDVAYYKDMADYKKRIPATYTDGLQLYLRPTDSQYYNISVIEGVEIKTPYYDTLKELVGKTIADKYTNINSTDAQAWITPVRWKFLKERLGKWSDTIDNTIYDKMTGVNKEPFTPNELKRAAQPLKGVYFEINEGVPVYLKYSQAVLVPSLIENSEGLKKMYDKMISSQIDEVVTIDGVKTGAKLPVNTHTEEGMVKDNFTFIPLQLKNSGWKLQQDLPVKGMKETDLGSQIQKIIYTALATNLKENFNITTFGNERSFTGAEMIEHIDSIVNRLSNKGLESLKQEFGIDENFKINNIDKLKSSLIDELKRRGANENIIKALEGGTSTYGVPGFQQKIQNTFASIVKDRVVKIKTNGGSFIQMSNYGINKNEATNKGVIWTPWAENTTHEYKYLKDANGNNVIGANGKPVIQPAGLLLSGSFIAKYLPNYRDYIGENGDTSDLFGTSENNYMDGKIDRRILENIIGYRIPNQGLASNDAFQIVGILPEEMGDTVVAYTGITTKTGSDFDIDKMYLMIPSFKVTTFDNKSKEIADDFASLFDGLDFQMDNIDRLEYIVPSGSVNDMSKSQLQNALIEAYKASLLNDSVVKDLMTPIDYEHVKNDITSLLTEEESKDLTNFSLINEVNTKYEFLAGKAGVGIEANAVVDHVRGLMGTLGFTDYYLGWGNELNGETKFDEEFSQDLSDADMRYYEKETGRKPSKNYKISNTLSALLNAFVDIAKDPYITKGNWNTITSNTGNMLVRAGVHPYYVNAFLAQPIIKEYVDYVNNRESIVVNDSGDLQTKFINEKIKQHLDKLESPTVTINGITKNKSLIFDKSKRLKDSTIAKIFNVAKSDENVKALIDEIQSVKEEYYKVSNIDVTTFSLKRLRDQIKGDVILEDQMAILNKFYEWQDQSKELVKNINASKMDVTGYGKNITSLVALDNLINSLLNNDKKGSFKGFETKLGTSILNTYKTNSIDFVKNVMENNPSEFLIANKNIINTFNIISNGIYGEALTNEKLATKLENNYYSYLMSGFSPFIMSSKEKESLMKSMPDKFLKFKKENPDNALLTELQVNIGDNSRKYVGMSNRKRSIDYQNDITNSWEDLLENPDQDVAEFAEELIKYSYLTSGFQMNLNQFYTYIPYTYMAKNNINEYIEETAINLINQTTVDFTFIDNFFRANVEDSQIVPYIFDSSIENDYNSPTGFVTKDKSDRLFVKKKVTIKDEFQKETDKLLLFELKGYTKDNQSIYVRRPALSLTDSKGNKIVEFDNSVSKTATFIVDNKIKINSDKLNELMDMIDTIPFSNIDNLNENNDVQNTNEETLTKTQQDIISLFDNDIKFLQENGINSIEDIKNLTEEQQGELLKKYCNQ